MIISNDYITREIVISDSLILSIQQDYDDNAQKRCGGSLYNANESFRFELRPLHVILIHQKMISPAPSSDNLAQAETTGLSDAYAPTTAKVLPEKNVILQDQLTDNNNAAEALGETLLDISILLMVSGANTERIRTTIDRISSRYERCTYILISQRTIIISIYNDSDKCIYHTFKRTYAHATNFTTVAEISRISWLVLDEKWTIEKIRNQLLELKAIPHYPEWLTLMLTGLAGAAFCRLANGGITDMIFVFLATFTGLYVRRKATRMRYNQYMCVYFSALCASLIAGLLIKIHPQIKHEAAFVTSVLFLIPGIPLINAFSDMIDGNIQNGLIRGLHGFIVSFFIALGLLSTMAIYQF